MLLSQLGTKGVHAFERVFILGLSGTRQCFAALAGLVGPVQDDVLLPWLVKSVRYKRIFSLLVGTVRLPLAADNMAVHAPVFLFYVYG
jgi:hypothetical protein